MLVTWLVLGAAVAGVAWLMLVFPTEDGPGTGKQHAVSLDEHTSLDELAEELGREGIVGRPRLWAMYMRLIGADEQLRSGRIWLNDRMTVAQVSRRLARGLGSIRVRVTIPEGYNRFDIASRLATYGVADAQAFLRATEDPSVLAAHAIRGPSVEGYLFPDTYELRDDAPPDQIVARMVENFHRRMNEVVGQQPTALERLRGEVGFDLHEVVVLASVVEKEAMRSEERPIIAGVFLNRLRSTTFLPRRRLQADPTVSYGCLAERDRAPSCASFEGRISRAMLQDSENRYNTYRHGGLPPGPIANPGLASLAAVLAATEHDYLYFVARGRGRHAFSATLRQHTQNVDRFIRRTPATPAAVPAAASGPATAAAAPAP